MRSSLRSIAVVTGMTVGSLLRQFALQLLLAKYFGAAAEMDAYVAALAVPVLVSMILSGSIGGYVLVPTIAKLQADGKEGEAAATITQGGIWLSLLAIFVAAVIVVVARPRRRRPSGF